ncbi:hypothetical protein [Limimaricola cinnabarinus]|uniref:Uncharacterized protein n=1 Tax=Limimaricola cinnabarinus LL-001 TaxID=1337093 RepID=U3AMA6_9RHOB|nr:hypothetical protein [Limimaricola cinnabarinus]GAD55868.1 hypothetical protein MBELCI_1920 [Limimaricola cinnabarinus LL-001]
MSILSKKHLGLTLAATLIAGAVGEFGFARHARAVTVEPYELFKTVEMEIGGVVYDVQIRKDPPTISAAGSAYFF